jgi:phage recombination protein Bet
VSASGEWTRERIDLIKRSICPKGISDDEFTLFVEQCKRSGLDPLLKQAFCVPREMKGPVKKNKDGSDVMEQWRNGSWHPVYERITRYEFQPAEAGMLARANRFPDYEGISAAEVYKDDQIEIDYGAGVVNHKVNPAQRKGGLVGAWARVQQRGKVATVVWVDFAEMAQKNSKNESVALWSSKPMVMIRKCARVAALRTAYPEEFGGLYVAGERPDDVDTGEEEMAAPPVERPALPPPAPRETLEVSPVKEKVPAEIDGSAGFAMMREPGSDDVPDDAENESLSIVHACESVQDMDAYRALAQRGMRLPDGTEAKRRASTALRRAHKRLTAQVQKDGATP